MTEGSKKNFASEEAGSTVFHPRQPLVLYSFYHGY
jgi:hypothetical protein